MTDEQILSMIKDNKMREQGYRALMDQYQRKLYQHIKRILNSHEDSNDVLQNTFVKVFRNIDQFANRSSLYTWIYRIASNEALSFIKKNKKQKLHVDTEAEYNKLENTLHTKEGPDPKIVQEMLLTAIETLPKKQKSVFSLRYYEEMSYKDMSLVMETSEGALKASFHHAVKKIEKYFKTANIF